MQVLCFQKSHTVHRHAPLSTCQDKLVWGSFNIFSQDIKTVGDRDRVWVLGSNRALNYRRSLYKVFASLLEENIIIYCVCLVSR